MPYLFNKFIIRFLSEQPFLGFLFDIMNDYCLFINKFI
jgi:hypothetical protein